MKGGLEPIANSSVTLYAAGTSGYGSGAIRLGSATTNAIGAFTISSYTCPSANAPTYIIASGGNAGAGANSAIGLMEALGRCDSLRPISDLTINELTTVAAQWALAQFLDSTGHTIGTSSTNATGLNNAFDGVFNLADFIGNPSSFLPTGAECASGSPPVNCDGLERLDTIANILAACVESTGPASTTCGTLLSNTDSSTTTLAAAHVMATHLTANVGSLFALQNGSSPFIPHLSAAPDGFEIALNFAPSGANFNGPSGVAIDAAGNVWVLNYSGDSVTELTSSGGLAGNFAPRGANFNGPFAVAIDTASHVWVTNDSGNSVTELTSSGALTGNFAPSGANFLEPEGVAIDAAGNVWMTNFFGDSVTELTSSGGLVGNFAPSGADIFTPKGRGNRRRQPRLGGELLHRQRDRVDLQRRPGGQLLSQRRLQPRRKRPGNRRRRQRLGNELHGQQRDRVDLQRRPGRRLRSQRRQLQGPVQPGNRRRRPRLGGKFLRRQRNRVDLQGRPCRQLRSQRPQLQPPARRGNRCRRQRLGDDQ